MKSVRQKLLVHEELEEVSEIRGDEKRDISDIIKEDVDKHIKVTPVSYTHLTLPTILLV